MPLDPAIKGVLAFVRVGRGSGRATVEQARAGLRALTSGMRSPASVVPVGAVEELPSRGARVYRPIDDSPLATVVFYHGGGFVIGDLDTHDHLCRMICREVGVVVVSVAYRLAPEHPHPAAVDDCLAAARWALAEGFPGPFALAGDSAGGSLAAIVAQELRDEIAAQLLICPATDLDPDAEYPSRVDNADGFFLTADDMGWFGECYLGLSTGEPADVTSPRVSPLRGKLSGLAPAVVVTAEYDPLRDEGEAYARALAEAGVPVRLHRFDGLIHGFFDFTSLSRPCADAVSVMCASFRELLLAQP